MHNEASRRTSLSLLKGFGKSSNVKELSQNLADLIISHFALTAKSAHLFSAEKQNSALA